MKKLLLLSMLLFYAIISRAQDRTITGRVVSAEDGTALPGVSVAAKERPSIGIITDVNGNYTLSLPPDVNVLVFSFIGTTTQEVAIGDRSTIDVALAQDAKQLSEVVVVGYGVQERTYVTGSITKIKGDEIQNLPVTSFEQALQGRTPGVQISSPGGELGAAMRIRVRGSSSITANNQPLVVIDGFIVTSATDQSNFIDNNASNPLIDLNPNDIESVDILKDASASAIYGARASNGVLIITTKRGGKGKTKFNINYSTGLSKATHLRKYLNRNQYIEMFSEAAKNSSDSDYSTNEAAWNNLGGSGSFSNLVSRGNNENWNESAFRTGNISQFDFSATGGNDKTNFFLSLGYLDQEGIIISNDFKRVSGRVNFDHTINSKIKIGASINQVYSKKNNVPENNQFNSPLQANALSPLLPIRDATGEYNDSTYYANPIRAIANYKDQSTQWRNFSNIYSTWDIIKNLNFRSEAGVDFLSLYEYGWQGEKFPSAAGTPSSGKYGTTRVINYNINNTLNYNVTVEKNHEVQFLIGQSFQKSLSEYAFIQGQGLPTDYFKYLANASQNTSFSSAPTSFAYTSYFGRLNYKFNNKYLLSASLRNDGSSRFGTSKKYGWFPSASAGWIITEEDFIKRMRIDNVLNFFKIKSSIGLTGNSEIDNFASRGLYSSAFYGSLGGIYPSQLRNDDLSWEKTTQWDLGIEFTLFNNRISGGVDYYIKKTRDLLLSVPITPTSGYANALRNLGKMNNKGWDIYIDTKNIDGKFKWSTSFNISTFKNEVTDLRGQTILPTNRVLNAAVEGQPLGVFYGVEYAGVDPETGLALFSLADGTTTVDWSEASQIQNYKILGNPNPKNYGGITNTFEYLGFDLTVFGQWSYGNKIYLSSGVFQSSGFTNYGLDNQTIDMLDYWKESGDVTNVPKPQLDINNGARVSSRYVSDGSYFRFKTITLGYTLPQSIIYRMKFSSVKIYVTSQNPFTITKYKGNDPEINYNAPTQSTQTVNINNGVDYYSSPQAKSIVFGMKLGF